MDEETANEISVILDEIEKGGAHPDGVKWLRAQLAKVLSFKPEYRAIQVLPSGQTVVSLPTPNPTPYTPPDPMQPYRR